MKTVENKNINYVDEFNGLTNHEVYKLVVSPYALSYDETKIIKQANLYWFFKIMNIIIVNNIDLRLYKTKIINEIG